jgi:hypothetical protein
MATIHGAIYYELSHDAGIAGALASVYPMDDVPQDAALPRVTFSMLSSEPQYHQGGTASLWLDTFQVDCYAEDLADAQALSDLVAALLAPTRIGDFGDPLEPVQVGAITVAEARDELAEFVPAEEAGPHRVSYDYSFWHR